MSIILSPEQLPHEDAQFIAYGAEERCADPMGGEPLTIRPQVYVRYYRKIMIKSLNEGGDDGDKSDLLTIHFDPKSVGLSRPITAHMDIDDATVPVLREAFQSQKPVAVAIETQRKKRGASDKKPISPLVPIHALRGAHSPDGSGDAKEMMGPSGNNISNRLAMVDGQATKHLSTVPQEWSVLVRNKAGDLPPEGWSYYNPGNDWKDFGAIIPNPASQLASAPAAAPVADASIVDAILANVKKLVTEAIEESNADPERPKSSLFEGKQWEPRTKDGRVNLGGYMPVAEGSNFRWAAFHLAKEATKARELAASKTHAAEANADGDDAETEELATESHRVLIDEIDRDEAWKLATIVMELADRVQVIAYDSIIVQGSRQGTMKTDRRFPSHKEACRWVQWTITHYHPYVEDIQNSEDAEGETFAMWAEEVVNDAAELLAETGRRAGQKMTTTRPSTPPPVTRASEPEGPSERLIVAILDGVSRMWNNPDAIRNMGMNANEKGASDAVVSVVMQEDGKPVLSYPAKEGEPSGTLQGILLKRWTEIKDSVDDGPAPATPPTQAPDAPTQAPSEKLINGYPESVASVILALHNAQNAGDIDALGKAYYAARDVNLLGTLISVQPANGGLVLFGKAGEPGYQQRSIAEVVSIIKAAVTARQVQSSPPLAETISEPVTEVTPEPAAEEPQEDAEEPQEDFAEDFAEDAAEPESDDNESPVAEEALAEPDPVEETPTPALEEKASTEDASVQTEDAPGESAAQEVGAEKSEEEQRQEKAQDIADRAGLAVGNIELVNALLTEASEAGVNDLKVMVSGRSGALRSYLRRVLKISQRAAEKA